MTDNDLLYELSGDAGPQSLRRSYFELGRSMLQLRDWESAIPTLQRSLQANDQTVPEWKIYVLLAFAYRQTPQSIISDQYLLQAIATAPPEIASRLSDNVSVQPSRGGEPEGFDPLLLLIGEAAVDRSKHNYPGAIEKMTQALELAVRNNISERQPSIRHSLAQILYEAGEFTKAEDHINILLNDPVWRNAALLLQAQCLLALQQYETPLQVAIELIKQENSLPAHILKLQCHLYVADYKEALETVHNAFTFFPSNEELQFYKMQILMESNFNISEAWDILRQLKTTKGVDYLADKLEEPYLRFRSHHGNDNFFIAQLYDWLPEKYTPAQALAEADKAVNEKVSIRDIDYPHGTVYQLKAQIYERMNDANNAAEFYCSAGKEFYWNRQYAIAVPLFEKSLSLNDQYIEAYRYFSDNQLLMSFTPDFPYVSKPYLEQSIKIWQAGYERQKPTVQDAWSYLTLARIHEQRCLVGTADRTIISQSAWLAVEKNMLLAGAGYFALTFISRIQRDMEGMEQSSYRAAKQAEELTKDNIQVLEAIAAISLNLGLWDEGLTALKQLRATYPTDAVYVGWEAFGVVGIRDYEKGLELSTEALERDPSWSWARQLRLVCNWFLDRPEAMQTDAMYLISKEKEYLDNKSYWDVAFAYFAIGDAAKAIAICETVPQTKEFEKYKYMYQSMYRLAMGDMDEAEKDLDKYLALCRVERDIKDHRFSLEKTAKGGPFFKEKLEAREKQVREYWAKVTPASELENLQQSRPEYIDPTTDGWLAWHLSHFRIMLDTKNWHEAVQEAELVNSSRKDYPDAGLMYDKLLLAMQAWLLSLLKNGEPFEDWTRLQATLEYFAPSFISLPDTWYIASLLAGHRGKQELVDEFVNRARTLYIGMKEEDMEKNIRRVIEQYPEVEGYLSQHDSASTHGSSVCKKCGSRITSPDQRFCYNCGDSLYSTTTMAVAK